MKNQQKVDTLALKRLVVKNENNENVPFRDLHKDKKTTFIFVRHFGCIACRAHVTQVMDQVKAGKIKTPVIFIGNGQASIIKAFKEDLSIQDEAKVYTDPTLQVFDACGLKRGLTYLVSLSTAKAFYRLSKQGYTQGKQVKENGYHTQMGGIVIFSKIGEVIYHYSSHYLGDFPDESLE